MNSNNRGSIFNIERYAVHDGPGIRTIVFLKGCPLRCTWCQNPEGQRKKPELAVFPDKCIGCGRCLEVCPTGAATEAEGNPQMDWSLCRGCLECARVCPGGARKAIGWNAGPEEVLAEVLKDLPFYRRSGGGVTLSGGDPVTQIGFSTRILALCKEHGLHTAIETCGHAPWEEFERVLAHTDFVLLDLKHMDPERHRSETGTGNERILENAERIARTGKEMVIRVPVIPGYNDDMKNILATVRFVRGLQSVKKIELLPYHTLGIAKYGRMGWKYGLEETEPLAEENLGPLKNLIREAGLECGVI